MINNFGKNLRDIRKENNLTIKQLASQLGVKYQSISNWELNKNIPNIEIIIKIAKHFNVSLEEIIR